MKTIIYRLKGRNYVPRCLRLLPILFAFFLTVLISQVSAQVNIAYAESISPATFTWGAWPSYTLNAKRIINTNPLVNEGTCLTFRDLSNITISNCIFGPSSDKALYFYHCTNITITNCIFLDSKSAITIDGGDNIKINNNQFINMSRVFWPGGGDDYGIFVQMSNVINASGCEIKNNVGENIPDFSDPEDLINIGGSTFTDSLIISGNRFRGYGPSESGSGINSGDDYPGYPVTSSVIVRDNILVNAGAIGIWATAANAIYDNNKVYGELRPYSNGGIIRGKLMSGCVNQIFKRNQANAWHGLNNGPVPWIYTNDIHDGGGCSNVTFYTSGPDANIERAPIDGSILEPRILAPFPVIHLKLDNDWNDYSGSGLNATPHSTSLVCDTYRHAATFNGTNSDWVEIPRSPQLSPPSQMITASIWIKPTSANNVQGFMRGQDEGWRLVLDGTNFAPRVVTNNGDINLWCPGINVGQWNHIAMTYDGRIMKGYVNGVLKDSSVLTGHISYTNKNWGMTLGGAEGTDNFLGLIAEAKFWYGNKTEAEITADFDESKGMFDGTIPSSVQVTGTYNTNYQNYSLQTVNPVYPDDYVYAYGSIPNGTSYSWSQTSGNPTYFSSSYSYVYFMLPPGGSINLQLTATASTCPTTVVKNFTFYATYYPFRAVYNPGTKNVVITAIKTQEKNDGMPTEKKSGPYTAEIFNLLGQRFKTGKITDGQLTINMGDLPRGIYFLRVTDGRRIVYSKKIVTMN